MGKFLLCCRVILLLKVAFPFSPGLPWIMSTSLDGLTSICFPNISFWCIWCSFRRAAPGLHLPGTGHANKVWWSLPWWFTDNVRSCRAFVRHSRHSSVNPELLVCMLQTSEAKKVLLLSLESDGTLFMASSTAIYDLKEMLLKYATLVSKIL